MWDQKDLFFGIKTEFTESKKLKTPKIGIGIHTLLIDITID